jgi:L-ascorbate oxidase
MIKVNPKTRVLVRLINAATLVYMTVCFEKHDVTVVAMDANPVKPITFRECVDINSGQR